MKDIKVVANVDLLEIIDAITNDSDYKEIVDFITKLDINIAEIGFTDMLMKSLYNSLLSDGYKWSIDEGCVEITEEK